DGPPFRIHPCVAISGIEVPMRIDQVPDRVAAELVGSLENAQTRGCNAGIDEDLAVSSGEDVYVASGAFEDADVAAQLMDGNWDLGGGVTDQIDDVARRRLGFAGGQPPFRGCECRCRAA